MVFANKSPKAQLRVQIRKIVWYKSIIASKFDGSGSLLFQSISSVNECLALCTFSAEMKKILSFLMLLCIATGSPVVPWEGYRWNMPYQWNFPPRYPSPLPLLMPPGQVFPSPGYYCQHMCPPPKHTICQDLQQLLNLPMNQQIDPMDNNCSIEWICQNFRADDMVTVSGQDNFTNSVTQNDMTEEPRHHGGEDMIDVRNARD